MLAALLIAALAMPAAASAATDGGISGTVTLAGGGPVEKASVCAEAEGEGIEPGCAETAADGSYEITGLQPAKYLVSFEAGESGRYLVRQFYNGASSLQDADEVTVASGVTTTGIDAALVEGGAIAGRVTSAATGAPLREVEVCSWGEGSEEFDGCAYSAADGSYEIAGVAPGLHAVEFWPPEGDGYDPAALHSVSVSVGTKTANVNAALFHPEGRITGRVYAAATHAPLQGVSVCAIWAMTGQTGGCAVTNRTGAYGFYPVSVGNWKIVFSPEPAEVELWKGVATDLWPTQFWNLKPTFGEADTLGVAPTSVFDGIDGLLGPGPAPAPSGNPPSGPQPTPTPLAKPLHCNKGFAKKRVKGKVRCVRRRHHHRRHHRGHKHRHR